MNEELIHERYVKQDQNVSMNKSSPDLYLNGIFLVGLIHLETTKKCSNKSKRSKQSTVVTEQEDFNIQHLQANMGITAMHHRIFPPFARALSFFGLIFVVHSDLFYIVRRSIVNVGILYLPRLPQ